MSPPSPVLQAGPVSVRTLGFAAVGLLVVVFLYFLVRYDDPTRGRDAGEASEETSGSFDLADGGVTIPSDGGSPPPAESEDRSDASRPAGTDEWGSASPEWDATEGDDADASPLERLRSASNDAETGPLDGPDPESEDAEAGPVLSHDVVDERPDAVVVEVTDGDRSGRFSVDDPTANPSITPASAATRRLDDEFRTTARGYLRAVVLAGELDADRGANSR